MNHWQLRSCIDKSTAVHTVKSFKLNGVKIKRVANQKLFRYETLLRIESKNFLFERYICTHCSIDSGRVLRIV